jgi:hypothetical protein
MKNRQTREVNVSFQYLMSSAFSNKDNREKDGFLCKTCCSFNNFFVRLLFTIKIEKAASEFKIIVYLCY